MEQLFIKSFWITNAMLIIALVILYFILTNRRSLVKKGYNKKYIQYLRKSHTIRIFSIALILPLLELLSAWIVSWITGPLTEEVQIAYIVLLLVVLVAPFKFIDEYINQKRIRKLAIETNEKVAIDFNYKTLHLIFNPYLEVILLFASLSYGILFLRIEQWIIYLFLLFPWFMYFNMRGIRFQTRPYLIDNYKYMYAFNLFSFLFFFVFFYVYMIRRFTDSISYISSLNLFSIKEYFPLISLLTIGYFLTLALIARISLYLANYRQFEDEISGKNKIQTNQTGRRLLFITGSIVLLLTISGVGLITGIFCPSKTNVGVLKEKILVDVSSNQNDTIAILNRNGYQFIKPEYQYLITTSTKPYSMSDLMENFEKQQLKAYCTIRLSLNNKLENYEMCCLNGFVEVPFETIIKFEYSTGNKITEILDY